MAMTVDELMHKAATLNAQARSLQGLARLKRRKEQQRAADVLLKYGYTHIVFMGESTSLAEIAENGLSSSA